MTNLFLCDCDNFVSTVIPGRSEEVHPPTSAEKSAERNKELSHETIRTSRDRLQNFPQWLQEFTDNLLEPRSISSGSESREQPESPRPDPLAAKAPKEQHSVFTHFQRDPHCEICKHAKVTRTACRRNSQRHILRATTFGDIITVDHKVHNEEG